MGTPYNILILKLLWVFITTVCLLSVGKSPKWTRRKPEGISISIWKESSCTWSVNRGTQRALPKGRQKRPPLLNSSIQRRIPRTEKTKVKTSDDADKRTKKAATFTAGVNDPVVVKG